MRKIKFFFNITACKHVLVETQNTSMKAFFISTRLSKYVSKLLTFHGCQNFTVSVRRGIDKRVLIK